jgi:hypothetical protein
MKWIKKYKDYLILESGLPDYTTIVEFVDLLKIQSPIKENIISWWEINRTDIKIYYFPFNTNKPIMGCFMGTDTILINSSTHLPSEIKFFIALHESKHADQEKLGIFTPGYFQTVVDGNKEEFLKNYRILENEANTFAINACKEIGFNQIVSMENRLRSNENMGDTIYNMMRNDILKTGATTIFELLKDQIL